MNHKTVGPTAEGFTVGVVVLCLSALVLAGAAEDYVELYGGEEKALAASKDPNASSAFAARLLEAARRVTDQKDLQVLLCEKASDFGMQTPAGYATGAAALRLLTDVVGDGEKKIDAQLKLRQTYEFRYAAAYGAQRKAVGQDLVDLLVSLGQERVDARQPDEALRLYKRALSVARAVRYDLAQDILGKTLELGATEESERKLQVLQEELKRDPNSTDARTELILAYLGEFNTPAEAGKLLTDKLDREFRKHVELAMKKVEDLDEASAIDQARWYADMAARSVVSDNRTLFAKARACCVRYMDLHPAKDASQLEAQLLLEKLTDAMNTTGKGKQMTLALGKGVTMKLVFIPAGKFTMSSATEERNSPISDIALIHDVTLTKPFYMGIYEVTQEQYEAVMGKNPSSIKGPNNPVNRVSWDNAVEFCKRLSAKTGKKAALPTEAQWEYACRAGTKTEFFFGNDAEKMDRYAWFDKNSGDRTHPVGQKKPNPWGLYDIYGNVFEWCQDWCGFSEVNIEHAVDPTGNKEGTNRVLRGGAYWFGSKFCPSAAGYGGSPTYANTECGLRVVVLADK